MTKGFPISLLPLPPIDSGLNYLSFSSLIVSNTSSRSLDESSSSMESPRLFELCQSTRTRCTPNLSVLDLKKILFHKIDFLTISNLIFTACVACNNQIQNRQKIKFKNHFCEIDILKNQVQIDKGICIKVTLFKK